MGVIGDVFQVLLKQTYQGQAGLNVFFYRQTNANNDPNVSSSNAVDAAFEQDVLPAIAATMLPAVTYDEIEVINLFDPGDLFSDSTPTPAAGTLGAGEETASFLAMEYTSARITRAIRRGFKRFWGFPEGWMTNGIYNNNGDPLPANVATALSADIQYSGFPATPTFEPVIVKRIAYTTPDDTTAYRLPETQLELVYNVATFTFQRISTQNSRKPF